MNKKKKKNHVVLQKYTLNKLQKVLVSNGGKKLIS